MRINKINFTWHNNPKTNSKTLTTFRMNRISYRKILNKVRFRFSARRQRKKKFGKEPAITLRKIKVLRISILINISTLTICYWSSNGARSIRLKTLLDKGLTSSRLNNLIQEICTLAHIWMNLNNLANLDLINYLSFNLQIIKINRY